MNYSVRLPNGKHLCVLCPNRCELSIGQKGKCLARVCDETGVVLEGYAKLTTIAVEPIEKKPIYHFKPNSKVLSIGSYGCSFSCVYCQNASISQEYRDALLKISAVNYQSGYAKKSWIAMHTYAVKALAVPEVIAKEK